MPPRVSVVVTTYNQDRYIEETLASVFRQTYPNREVIVVDDGSTDETAARVARFGERLRYVRQPNRGVADSRNSGVREARGELVAFLDGDDVWDRDKLAVQVDAALTHPDVGVVAVEGVQFGEDGVISPSLLPRAIRDHVEASWMDRARWTLQVDARQWRAWLLRGANFATVSQVMIPRRVLDEVGPSDSRFVRLSDYDLYLRISERYGAVVVSEPLVRWRYLSTSVSGPSESRELGWSVERVEVLRKHRRRALTREERAALAGTMRSVTALVAKGAYYFGRRQDPVWARHYLLRLLARGPRRALVAAYLAGLCCPEGVTRMYARARRRLR